MRLFNLKWITGVSAMVIISLLPVKAVKKPEDPNLTEAFIEGAMRVAKDDAFYEDLYTLPKPSLPSPAEKKKMGNAPADVALPKTPARQENSVKNETPQADGQCRNEKDGTKSDKSFAPAAPFALSLEGKLSTAKGEQTTLADSRLVLADAKDAEPAAPSHPNDDPTDPTTSHKGRQNFNEVPIIRMGDYSPADQGLERGFKVIKAWKH